MTTETITTPTVSREVLEDRWDGLLWDREEPDEWSRRHHKLIGSLNDLIAGVARREQSELSDNGDPMGFLVQDIFEMAHRMIIDRVDELGLAKAAAS